MKGKRFVIYFSLYELEEVVQIYKKLLTTALLILKDTERQTTCKYEF